mmetsp:Transcript_92352/g.287878  ORF Transcript_92352/g.287878 Transcript_92352/m.287878 type:complete len:171 (+) Transcript_92352:3-515(+)
MLELAAELPGAHGGMMVDEEDARHILHEAGSKRAAPSRARLVAPALPAEEERPDSPLRPGVYVGRNGQQYVPVFPRKLLPAGMAPDPGVATAQAPAGPLLLGSPAKGSPSGAAKLQERPKVSAHVQKLLEQDDTDADLASEREQYNLWKKKVIESARNLQLEVGRFHFSA